ncbi:hypothetical protein SLE2022_013240 [Rubroshorea leprosula]
MNSISSFFLLVILLLTSSLCLAARPESFGSFSAKLKQNNKGSQSSNQNNKDGENPGGFNVPGFNIPGWENGGLGGGYGFGVGGPNGGSGSGGVIQPSVVCKDTGPCFHKKLTCPANCFDSYSRSGKGWGMGGGGGGCTIDCKKKCRAYC